LPFGIDINVAGRTGAHAAADRRDAVVQLPQVFHDLETGLCLDLMLLTVAIDHAQQSHLPTSVRLTKGPGARRRPSRLVCRIQGLARHFERASASHRGPSTFRTNAALPPCSPRLPKVARSSRRSVSKTRSYSPKIWVLKLPVTT